MKKIIYTALMVLGFVSLLKGQDFYDINTINTIEITFTESNWDYLLDNLAAQGNEERLLGMVTINGIEYDSVGVRYKGNSSYNSNQVKNPLNIKLDYIIDDQEIDDFGTIKLSNEYNDPSFVRETLSYEIARKYMAASGSNYANVYVNGTYLGLYTSNQDVDKQFMRMNFSGDENARFKGEITGNTMPGSMGGVWLYNGPDSADYYDRYEAESDFGWDRLVNFIDTINNHSDLADQVLNIDRNLWFLACSNILVNLDGPINNPQNYYLYEDNNGRFNIIPWDFNESFGVFSMLQSGGNLSTTGLQHLSPFVNETNSNYPNIKNILSNDTYRKIYVAHMKTIIEENFSNGLYESRALEMQAIIDADVQADPNKFYTYSNFISNINSTIGGGGGPHPSSGVIGITELMEERISYISGLTEFAAQAPEINETAYSPTTVSPNSEVNFTATTEFATQVYLMIRDGITGLFQEVEMYDDGNHQDGSAGDGIFGVSITVSNASMQYYFYAENDDAASLLPVRAQYEFFSLPISGEIVINEFMADNVSTVTDQDGDYDDWIELFNNSNEIVSLLGLYLTDDVSELDLWAFPDTTIAANGYLIVWADKDDEQEGLHADLKLSKSGEVIILSDGISNVIDEVVFEEQYSDTTTGRFPNGTGEFMLMLPSFEYENYNEITGFNNWDYSDATSFTLYQNYPNPFSTQTIIPFTLSCDEIVTIKISDMYGKTIAQLSSKSFSAGQHEYKWQNSGVTPGIYLYSVTVGNSQQIKKMVVR